jgi:hypothetical protein
MKGKNKVSPHYIETNAEDVNVVDQTLNRENETIEYDEKQVNKTSDRSTNNLTRTNTKVIYKNNEVIP